MNLANLGLKYKMVHYYQLLLFKNYQQKVPSLYHLMQNKSHLIQVADVEINYAPPFSVILEVQLVCNCP